MLNVTDRYFELTVVTYLTTVVQFDEFAQPWSNMSQPLVQNTHNAHLTYSFQSYTL